MLYSPFVTDGFSHPYHLDEHTFIVRGIRSKFSFLFHFDEIPVSNQNNTRWDATIKGVTFGAILFANAP